MLRNIPIRPAQRIRPAFGLAFFFIESSQVSWQGIPVDKEKRFVKVPLALFDLTSPTELAVWAALASFVNLGGRDDLVWPSQNTIAKMVGLGRTTTNRTLKSLEAKGLIIMDSSDLGIPNCYAVPVHNLNKGCLKSEHLPVQNPNTNKIKKRDKVKSFKNAPKKWAEENGQWFMDRINASPIRREEKQSPNGHGQIWKAIKEHHQSPEHLEEMLKPGFWSKAYEGSKWAKRKGQGNAGYGKRMAFTIHRLLSEVATAESRRDVLEAERIKQMERFTK